MLSVRICKECSREFVPSSRHLRCPACRARNTCACGRPEQAKSATCLACRSVAESENGNWKGGRTRHKAGYILARAPGHPRASGRSNYVFEHILVAEEPLGRYLCDGEPVHHRNGVRDDNRPENLELWTRPQPTGIRVSDAVKWAHEIIERYEGLAHPQQPSRFPLRALGGGGNRTRVLQYLTRASPGAACCVFLSPGSHASKLPTGSAAVNVPPDPAAGSDGGSS